MGESGFYNTVTIYWAFPEKNCNPPVEDINGKFQGGQSKSRWNSRGVHQKLRKKHGFPVGSMEKNRKFQGGQGKFHRKSRGTISKKSTGVLQFFSGKAQYITTWYKEKSIIKTFNTFSKQDKVDNERLIA